MTNSHYLGLKIVLIWTTYRGNELQRFHPKTTYRGNGFTKVSSQKILAQHNQEYNGNYRDPSHFGATKLSIT